MFQPKPQARVDKPRPVHCCVILCASTGVNLRVGNPLVVPASPQSHGVHARWQTLRLSVVPSARCVPRALVLWPVSMWGRDVKYVPALVADTAHPGCCSCSGADFLPFTCDCCTKVFCLDHRSYRTHECPVAGTKDTHAIACPICAGSIRVEGDEDPNAAVRALLSLSPACPVLTELCTVSSFCGTKPRCAIRSDVLSARKRSAAVLRDATRS